jgi:hypothetical protein
MTVKFALACTWQAKILQPKRVGLARLAGQAQSGRPSMRRG